MSSKEAKEIIQFERVDPGHVEECTQAAFPAEIDEHLAKRDAASKKQAAQRETAITKDLSEKHQVCGRQCNSTRREQTRASRRVMCQWQER